jgi:tRNA-modifying protein YgfZ
VAKGFSLGHPTLIRFQGSDRWRVFNNLCTQDLRKLSHGQCVETFVTDVKGRTFGHGLAFANEEDAYLLTVPDQGERLVPHFDRYIIREDAIVSDVSNEFQMWLLEDESVAAKSTQLSLEQLPPPSTAMQIDLAGNSAFLIHAAWIGPNSFTCLVHASVKPLGAPPGISPPNTLPPNILTERLATDLIESDMQSRVGWEAKRIRANWPWYGLDMDERNLPQELGRDRLAISFNKGCYLGQETIARLDALGQVQKKLVRLEIEADIPPAAQSPVLSMAQSMVGADEKQVGTICSSAFDPETKCSIALAYVKRSHFQNGTTLRVGSSTAVVIEA